MTNSRHQSWDQALWHRIHAPQWRRSSGAILAAQVVVSTLLGGVVNPQVAGANDWAKSGSTGAQIKVTPPEMIIALRYPSTVRDAPSPRSPGASKSLR